jgi:hypothetical protein
VRLAGPSHRLAGDEQRPARPRHALRRRCDRRLLRGLGAFAKVDLTDRETIAASHYVFGGIKLCAALPITAEQQLDAGEDWTVVAGGGSDSEPGSWGGHSMYSVGYDHKRGILVWTWGREQWMSWEWAAQYGDEAYALISNDYLRGSGKTPQGFDQTALNALLKRIDG